MRAGVGPCSDGNHLSNSVKKQAVMAGSGWEAAAVGGSAVEGRGSVIVQRQVLQSWVVIDRVDGVRDGVLLVLPSVVHRDRYPQCFSFSWVRGVAAH